MTTYLAIYKTTYDDEIRVAPLCENCRSVRLDSRADNYEFDEVCEICGVDLPAAPPRLEVSLGYLYDDVGLGHRRITLEPTPPIVL